MDGVVSRAYPGEFEARRFDYLQKYPQLNATSGAYIYAPVGNLLRQRATGRSLVPRPNQNPCRAIQIAGRRRTAPSVLSVRRSDPGVAWSKGCTALHLRGRALVRLRLGSSGRGRTVTIEMSSRRSRGTAAGNRGVHDELLNCVCCNGCHR